MVEEPGTYTAKFSDPELGQQIFGGGAASSSISEASAARGASSAPLAAAATPEPGTSFVIANDLATITYIGNRSDGLAIWGVCNSTSELRRFFGPTGREEGTAWAERRLREKGFV